MADWTRVLDTYEDTLVSIRDAAAAGNSAGVPPFVPPAGLGAMPDTVVARAQELLRRSNDLERFIQQARDAVRSRLQTRPTQAAPRRASRLDVSV